MSDKCKCCGVVLRPESGNEDGNSLQINGLYHRPWRCRDELARQLAYVTAERDEAVAACRLIYGLRFTGHVVGEVIEAVRAVVTKANIREGAKP